MSASELESSSYENQNALPRAMQQPRPDHRVRNSSDKGPRLPDPAPFSPPPRKAKHKGPKARPSAPASTKHGAWKSKRTEIRPGTATRSSSTKRTFSHYDKPNDHMLNFRKANQFPTVERSYKTVTNEHGFDPFVGFSRLISEKADKIDII